MQSRENALNDWVKSSLKLSNCNITLLAGDASFRKYWRIQTPDGPLVLMDAPKEQEEIRPFIAIDKALRDIGVHAPKILAENHTLGALILEDFGDIWLLNQLSAASFSFYYHEAMRILEKIQNCHPQNYELRPFNKAHMMQEMQLFIDWYWKRHLGLPLSETHEKIFLNTFEWISHELETLPQVFIHRDYHSRNLMCLPSTQTPRLGVLDFQDAMIGPMGYDLVSLLKDCYISWPSAQVIDAVKWYYDNFGAKGLSFHAFHRAFELCGIQRHLKVLGIFCRLNYRDGKSGYLKDLKLTQHYLMTALRGFEPTLTPFIELLEEHIVCQQNLQSY